MPGLVIFSFMSNILGLLPLVVLLQSPFWTGSVEMGMGIEGRWNIILGIDRNGSQLGGVNVWVLGLFRNSFPHSQNRPFVTFRQYDLIPFTLPYRRKGGNNAHPHSSHCMLWYIAKHLPTLFCSNPFTQSHVVK